LNWYLDIPYQIIVPKIEFVEKTGVIRKKEPETQ